MERKGKRKVKEEEELEKEEEEEEISKFVLSIMEGYNDSVMPPLSQLQRHRPDQNMNITQISTINERPKPANQECLGRERDRRLKMNENFALLESIVPGLFPKSTKEKVLQTTTEYIKYLEETKKMLETLKQESSRPKAAAAAAATGRLVFPCTSRNSSVTVTACGSVAFFGIQFPKRQGFVTQIFVVFQKHSAEVLAANLVVNDAGMLTLTVTAFVNGNESVTIEEIKRDILML